MDIVKRFKKDIGNYLLGVIIPSVINAIAVPVFKKILGASVFGVYGIRYNFMLLVVAFSAGWLYQSIIRLKFREAAAEGAFIKSVFKLCLVIVVSVSTGAFLISLLYFKTSVFFSGLMAACILTCSLQNIFIAISQASFLSRFIMFSEAIRTSSFFILALVFLKLGIGDPVYMLFISLLCSYIISALLLANKNGIVNILRSSEGAATTGSIRRLLQYGIPLAAWYLISNLLLFLDKPLIARTLGNEVQGHYQALYEIINKGAMVLLIPVLYAIFPLLSDAFEKNDNQAGMKFLKKIISIELLILVAGLAVYWAFGFRVLSYFLNVPETIAYKSAGFIMLASVLVWQIGMLLQKPFELRLKTLVLLKLIFVTLLFFLGILYCLKYVPVPAVYMFALPFFGASVFYVSGCAFLLRRFQRRGWK